MKGIPISRLALDELCSMYRLVRQHYEAKVKMPERCRWSKEECETDMNEIFEAMENKIPASHRWEYESILKGETRRQQRIECGYRYKHVSAPVHIEIVQEEDGLWSARLFINKLYVNRILIRTSTILEHYQRMS